MDLAAAGRIPRRLVTVPATLLATAALLVCSPVLVLLALILDLLTGPRRLRWLRLLAMVLQYLLLEVVAIVLALALWLATGFGLLNGMRWSQLAHLHVQQWWGGRILAAAGRWLGTSVELENPELLTPGPVVIAAHHRSFFDALLPTIVGASVAPDMMLRHTMKRELQLSPALDLFGHRLPNHFVDRRPADRQAEVAAFEALAHDLGGGALVVFPEGTFHSPERAARARARVAKRDPERADLVGGARNVLPIRPGGLLAAIRAAPTADVVIIGHVGFGAYGSFRSIIANVPFRTPVRVRLWRIPAGSLPDDDASRLETLDRLWLEMDDWISTTEELSG